MEQVDLAMRLGVNMRRTRSDYLATKKEMYIGAFQEIKGTEEEKKRISLRSYKEIGLRGSVHF